jgi:tRNA threonylcarbamoyladenosine biosynthesis protein TsaB
MKILAIDTVTEMCSVALLVDQEVTMDAQLVKQSHTDVILPMIDQLLANSAVQFTDVDAIAFSRGPGSFTGLRIGAGVTQGLALAYDMPVIPVSSLAALAQGAWRQDQQTQVLACIDARRQEVYWACFQLQQELMACIGQEKVSVAGQVKTPSLEAWYGVGSGFASYRDELSRNQMVTLSAHVADRFPLAQDILPFAVRAMNNNEYVDASAALPVYLRDNVTNPSA